MNPYYNEALPRLLRKRFDDQTKMVSEWARDIRQQEPDISHGQAIEIAERWLVEWRKRNWI